jgi:hypothetical protein
MPLDEATRRLAFLLQRDLRRLVERERARSDRGEEVRYDPISRMATWETRRGDVIGRWYGEVIADYVLKDRILRWAWAGRGSLASRSHAEVVSQEGLSRSVSQLSMSVVGELDEDDACTLARLGLLVARGEGLEIERGETEIRFIGLFDSPRPREENPVEPSRYSVPPPAVTTTRSSPPGVSASASPRRASSPPTGQGAPTPPPPYRSLPPIREIYGPRTASPSRPQGQVRPASSPPDEPRIREPARGIFVPVATSVLATLIRATPGFQQALFVLTVHGGVRVGEGEPRRRLVVTLAALDSSGLLRSIDPSQDLVEAAARMVEADRIDGNGPWRKLTARIAPKADGGATLNVDVT